MAGDRFRSDGCSHGSHATCELQSLTRRWCGCECHWGDVI